MEKTDLKPCPFCGSSNLKTGGDDKFVGVWCNDCQSTGPNHYGRSEWNTRAKPPMKVEKQQDEPPEIHDPTDPTDRMYENEIWDYDD